MRCRACNRNLTDAEASLKYLDWHTINDPEERYVGLCIKGGCLKESGLVVEGNPLASDEEFDGDDGEPEEESEDELLG